MAASVYMGGFYTTCFCVRTTDSRAISPEMALLDSDYLALFGSRQFNSQDVISDWCNLTADDCYNSPPPQKKQHIRSMRWINI